MRLDALNQFDHRVSDLLRLEEDRSLFWRLAVFFAHSGDSWFWMVALGILWLLTSGFWHRWAAFMALCIGFEALLVFAIKFAFKRTRPPGEWGGIYRKTDPHSFPSGHATRAFLIATLAALLGPAWAAIILIIWAPLVALARISTGVHYFLDVLAGALLGIISALIYYQLMPAIIHWLPFLFN